jgi:hypothetical protein
MDQLRMRAVTARLFNKRLNRKSSINRRSIKRPRMSISIMVIIIRKIIIITKKMRARSITISSKITLRIIKQISITKNLIITIITGGK